MSDIFLSYSHLDVDAAKCLVDALAPLGWSIWWDSELRAGNRYDRRIWRELESSRCVLVLWSKNSVGSDWVVDEANIGKKHNRLVTACIHSPDEFDFPPGFGRFHTESLAGWNGEQTYPAFQKLVSALSDLLGSPPNSAQGQRTDFARRALTSAPPRSVMSLDLPKEGRYFPSPLDWKDEVFYLLIPDRFSDGGEEGRLPFERAAALHRAVNSGAVPLDAWLRSGSARWQGGTLKGVVSKLDYLAKLGITVLWLWPVWKQRAASNTYHGYAVQDFLDVDPRLGTREDLVDLIGAAHLRGMRVILSGEIHHSGTNWLYPGAQETVPYVSGQYALGAWLGRNNEEIRQASGPDEGVWPVELQNPSCYFRAGFGRLGSEPGDCDRPDSEPMRSDFFSLRTFDPRTALDALIACHRYWIALTNCDGFHLDLVAREPIDSLNSFCRAIREYAARLGKENFFLMGEIYNTEASLSQYYSAIGRTLHGGLSAILDSGPMRWALQTVAKGLEPGSRWFSGYDEKGELGEHRSFGSRHVSVLEDPDNVGGPFLERFSTNLGPSHVTVGVAMQLFCLGIPCIYYGTEQALASPVGADPEGPEWGRDIWFREALFGPEHPRSSGLGRSAPAPDGFDPELPGFGPAGTSGRHVFDSGSPSFSRISAMIRLRSRIEALRSGRQYPREISRSGAPFAFPPAGEIIAWSRILDDEEVLCIANPNISAPRGADVTVDSSLNKEGGILNVLLSTASCGPDVEADPYAVGTQLPVKRVANRAFVEIRDLPPGEVLVVAINSFSP